MNSVNHPATQALVPHHAGPRYISPQDIEDAVNAAFRAVLWRDEPQTLEQSK